MSSDDRQSLPAQERIHSDLLDHAAEFVARVQARAPRRFEQLRAQRRIDALLTADNSFNAGKLHVYAEFQVFREEFDQRFPGAGREACINAFCRLFLKNDISISNLVRALEGDAEDDLTRLARLDQE